MILVILGLSITSSWGNGHATTYRGLVRELTARGHDVLFLERDVPWYAENRDLPHPPYCRTELYQSLADLNIQAGNPNSIIDLDADPVDFAGNEVTVNSVTNFSSSDFIFFA